METVCIYNAPDHFSALSAKEILEAEDIIVIFPNEFSSLVKPAMAFTNNYKLIVSIHSAQKASDLLKAHGFIEEEDPFNKKPEVETSEYISCPACKSSSYSEKVKHRWILQWISLITTGKSYPYKEILFTCRHCNQTWTRNQENG